jgi:hypothetical protein
VEGGEKPMPEANPIIHQAGISERRTAVRVLANSMFRHLIRSGYSKSHVIDFTSELLQLLTESIQSPAPAPGGGVQPTPSPVAVSLQESHS